MTVLLLAAETPLPPNSGARLRTVQLARQLASVFEVELAVLGESGDADGEPFTLIAVPHRTSRGRALVGSIRRPYGAAKAGSRRMEALVRARRPAVAQAEALWTMPAALASAGPAVLDAHNVESELLRRMAIEAPNAAHRLRFAWEARKTAAWEARAARAARAVCVTSDLDAATFEQLGARELVIVPNGVDCRQIPYAEPADTPTLIYVGHYGYQPNAAAAIELVNEVLPRVRAARADARARIVGRDPTPALRGRAGGAVEVTGTVADVLPHLREAGVLVVPLRSGGGTRLKILEALAAGVPVVSTPLGVEGLAVRDGEHVLLGRTSADLAALAHRVLDDRDLAHRLSRAGRNLVERTYDWGVVARPLIALHDRLRGSG